MEKISRWSKRQTSGLMNYKDKVTALSKVGRYILSFPDELNAVLHRAQGKNPWFTIDFGKKALTEIAQFFLTEELLLAWGDKYKIQNQVGGKRVGLVLAGNIPAVGFHDVLCSFICDHISVIKYSEKDDVLIPHLLEKLIEFDPRADVYFEKVERLQDFEAVIATGSNNSARYFEYYFGKYPNIIRRNRNAVAVLNGQESDEDLEQLGHDIFTYFGLGCRNVSKVYIPKGYDLDRLLEATHKFNELIHHNKYKNNFDYTVALYLLNLVKYLNNGCLIVRESEDIASRISCLHYEYYDDRESLSSSLLSRKEEIQCIVSGQEIKGLRTFGFGEAQKPSLMDYADDVDTIQFLLGL